MHQRLATIRLVTENFRELQGLRLAGPGAVNTLAFSGWLLLAPDPETWNWLPLVVCMIQGFLVSGLNRYYESRFGVVEGGAWNTKVVVGVGVTAALILTLHRPSFAAVFVPFAVLHLWSVVRDFPHRSYHLIAAAGAFAGIAIAASADPVGPDRSLAIAVLVHGLSVIVPGLLDHQLLVGTMGRRGAPVESGDGGTPDPAPGRESSDSDLPRGDRTRGR
jgi:hypothetical protein